MAKPKRWDEVTQSWEEFGWESSWTLVGRGPGVSAGPHQFDGRGETASFAWRSQSQDLQTMLAFAQSQQKNNACRQSQRRNRHRETETEAETETRTETETDILY